MERFKIIGKIGEGAYSTVYTVKRIEDEKIYALKKVKIKKLSQKEKTNALNEVRILASVNSPYIIGYKESFIDETDQTLCIIMEYADDGDLFQKIKLYIKNNTIFMEEDIWRIFIQITKGLHDLHEYNILHRDLKSANVFLFKDGTAKLGDLNVSKITSRGLGCTQTGTPYYASPEVWKDNPYNLKSDIWSLGCVFYELIMLKTPFRAQSMKELYKKVMIGEYPPIPKIFSKNFQIVIDRILKVKPEERPNTKEILEIPEVVDKIEELKIFDKKNSIHNKNINNSLFNTCYNINQKICNRNTSEAIIEANSACNNYINDECMINKMKSNKNNKKINKNERKSNINKSMEFNNKKYVDFKLSSKNIKKNEIFNIYKLNMDYFKQKYKQEKKVVLNTIKYPKKLIKLNNKLPEAKYDDENINQKRIPIQKYYYLYPHQILPKIKNNKNNDSSIKDDIINKKEKEENKNEINEENTNKKKQIFNKYLKMNNKDLVMKTLKMKVNQKHPFNYKGEIDIIIEE